MAVKFPHSVDSSAPEFEFYSDVVRNPLIQGVLIENVSFEASGTVKIKHKLGRPAIGWIVVDRDAVVDFTRSSSNTRPASELWIVNNTATAVVASFWIF